MQRRAADADAGVVAAEGDRVPPGAEPLGILYGGSVTTGNAADLLRLEEVDGLFVGRAAWTPDGFAAILVLCAQVLAEREEGRTVNEPDAGRDPPS